MGTACYIKGAPQLLDSDCANVWPAVEALLNAGIEIHCLRDLTRGGMTTTLNEIASDRNVCIRLEEALIPVEETVQSACEILGLDPLYVANEGRFAVFVPAAQAEAALGVLKKVEVSRGAVRVGTVEESPGRTSCKAASGATGWSICSVGNSCRGSVESCGANKKLVILSGLFRREGPMHFAGAGRLHRSFASLRMACAFFYLRSPLRRIDQLYPASFENICVACGQRCSVDA